MDNNRDFFEKLAGISSEEEANNPDEVEAQLTRASKSALKEKEKVEDNFLIDKDSIIDDAMDFEDAEGHLMIDVYQTAETIIIESAIAGITADELDIAITPESVTIKGERKRKEKVKKDDYLYQECFWGKFTRSIILPQEIDPDKSQAALKDGVLKITLPKVSKTKSKRVRVKFD
ncbi:MAG TPA: Hsp20/alpha crystallin family protein [Candidatus Paceibacterota bacterium]|nr:Hsp20/alpha crystallin family protein [Candidatus Paceibacterota bacterium]